ncbi:MAG: FAD-binding oxidoreductase [Acidiferrobacterales bacterium]
MHSPPLAVVFGTGHEQVVEVIRACNELGFSITTRGRGTGTAGGAVPAANSIVLSLERMDEILNIDTANRMLDTQAGVLNQAVQDAIAELGFFWAPDPTSAAFCTVGGNIAVNSAGPRSLKYGSTRENVLHLKAVTGDGRTIHTGEYTTKGVVGYDLTRLIIGSEGTLAVVTEATLKLTPLPEAIQTMQLIYRDVDSAAEAVVSIMGSSVTPRSLEIMDQAALDLIRNEPGINLAGSANAILIAEVDGDAASLDGLAEKLSTAARNDGLLEARHARTEEEKRAVWSARKKLSPALRRIAPNKLNEDVVVPVANLARLISGLGELSTKFKIPIVNFGHAGNGNIHVNLLYDTQNPEQAAAAKPCLDAVFALVLSLKGSLSGEHGVGIAKRDYVDQEIDRTTLTLMRSIKTQFDPNNILNPGKVLPPPG